MEVHHPVFYVSLGHMQNSMRSSVTLKLKLTLTLTLTLTDTGGAVLTLMLAWCYSPCARTVPSALEIVIPRARAHST